VSGKRARRLNKKSESGKLKRRLNGTPRRRPKRRRKLRGKLKKRQLKSEYAEKLKRKRKEKQKRRPTEKLKSKLNAIKLKERLKSKLKEKLKPKQNKQEGRLKRKRHNRPLLLLVPQTMQMLKRMTMLATKRIRLQRAHPKMQLLFKLELEAKSEESATRIRKESNRVINVIKGFLCK